MMSADDADFAAVERWRESRRRWKNQGQDQGTLEVEDANPVASASHLQMGRTERRARVRRGEPSFWRPCHFGSSARHSFDGQRVDGLVESGRTPPVSNELAASLAIFRRRTSSLTSQENYSYRRAGEDSADLRFSSSARIMPPQRPVNLS